MLFQKNQKKISSILRNIYKPSLNGRDIDHLKNQIIQIIKKFNQNNKEIARKTIHIGIGPLIPIAQFLKINQNLALIFTGIISLMILINYIYKLFPIIEDVERKSYGTIFYCLSLFILIWLFWVKDPSLNDWIFYMPLSAVFGSITFCALVGLFFGIWPAKRAAKLDPAVSLRYE